MVLPSYYGEGVPRSILEGMAMGRAIITSNSVGCKETISPHLKKTNGFLVPIKNVRELVSKMEYYILHKDDIIKFGLNGRKYAEEKFDVNKVNQQMLKILVGPG
jgi:glycosyltransferase involved in cell wall biosynthesis